MNNLEQLKKDLEVLKRYEADYSEFLNAIRDIEEEIIELEISTAESRRNNLELRVEQLETTILSKLNNLEGKISRMRVY